MLPDRLRLILCRLLLRRSRFTGDEMNADNRDLETGDPAERGRVPPERSGLFVIDCRSCDRRPRRLDASLPLWELVARWLPVALPSLSEVAGWLRFVSFRGLFLSFFFVFDLVSSSTPAMIPELGRTASE